MAKLTGLLGMLAAIFAIADLIHGQHNGDIHRTYIHVPEFILFFTFLCLMEALAFRFLKSKVDLNLWLASLLLSVVSGILFFVLFAICGGSMHGDGGPIAFALLVISAVAEFCFPFALAGFIVSSVMRKRAGLPLLSR